MDYTKDLILNVNMQEINYKVKNKTSLKSRFLKKLDKHKITIITLTGAILFIMLDIILLTNFINLLVNI